MRTPLGSQRGNAGSSTGAPRTPRAPEHQGSAGSGGAPMHPAAQASRDGQAAGETRMAQERERRWAAYRSTTS